MGLKSIIFVVIVITNGIPANIYKGDNCYGNGFYRQWGNDCLFARKDRDFHSLNRCSRFTTFSHLDAGFFGGDFPRNFVNGTQCSCTSLDFTEIVATLQRCGWKSSVVITSDENIGESNLQGRSTLGSGEIPDSCQHRNGVFLSKVAHSVLEAFQVHLMPIQHFHVHARASDAEGSLHRLEEIIWTSYNSHRIRNYVWVSPKPLEILDAAQRIFERYSRGRGALMPHRVRFVLIDTNVIQSWPVTLPRCRHPPSSSSSLTSTSSLPSPSHMILAIVPFEFDEDDNSALSNLFHLPHSLNFSCKPSVLPKHKAALFDDSVFDNVLLLTFTLGPSCSSPYLQSAQAHTLMWRDGRTREFEFVSDFAILSSGPNTRYFSQQNRKKEKHNRENRCAFFPNFNSGMNGRHLSLLTKEWYPYLTLHKNGDALKYSGAFHDITEVLSTSMNFTYTLIPDPVKFPNITWDELRDMFVKDGIGDSLWSLYYITSSLIYNYSQPYPMFVINMTGVHVSTPKEQVHVFFIRIDLRIYTVATITLILVVIFYSCLCKFQENWFNRKESSKIHRDCLDQGFRSVLLNCGQNLVDILGSCFGQSSLPTHTHKLLSTRLLIFFWCIMILTLTAALRGHLTSNLVNVKPALPFTTFRGMMERGDFRWGHYSLSTFMPVMATDSGQTLSMLYEGMMRFRADDPGVTPLTARALMLKAARDDKFVAIIDSFYMKEISYMEGIKGITAIPESLGINGLAPVVPLHSELGDLLSEHTIALFDAGIFDMLMDRMNRELESSHEAFTAPPQDSDSVTSTMKKSNTVDILFGLMLCAFSLSFGVAVLVAERLVACLKAMRLAEHG
ncbi:hypothetical protein PoB_004694900 [Plakobranchus ocellatus]|uniref:Ionotropic glutamate receptor C-terminal domain-containing protein n=1 Tax=Plakobranchus ocellatus TaxID=259542 RepID=A0AAV4BQ52_9GAST|nr:hypothetical protein PoB_004694900 [Plakobranchus ocellatus]